MNPSPVGESQRISAKPSNSRMKTPDARMGAIQCFFDWNSIDSFAMRLSAMAMVGSSDGATATRASRYAARTERS